MAWGLASMRPTEEILRSTVAPLNDFPANASLTKGAQAVARLAAFRAVQEFAFEPVMEALAELQALDWNPDQPFLVAESVKFDWRTAPIRKYRSFEDFYHRELETTWGKWTDLQATYQQLIRGEISEADARSAVARARQEAEESPQGKHHPNVRMKQGNSVERKLRRLARLKPDVLDAYERGEFPSVDAAFRHAFALNDLRRAWACASPADRTTFLAEVEKAFWEASAEAELEAFYRGER